MKRKMKNGLLFILLCLCLRGCRSNPKVVSREEFDRICEKKQALTGYHQDYLGSDAQHHYVRVGIATGDASYRIRKSELYIIKAYAYAADGPRVENLFRMRGLQPPIKLRNAHQQLLFGPAYIGDDPRMFHHLKQQVDEQLREISPKTCPANQLQGNRVKIAEYFQSHAYYPCKSLCSGGYRHRIRIS